MTLLGPAGRPPGGLRRRLSQAAGLAAVAIAAAAISGSWAGLPLLATWGAGLPALWPAGALCLAALGTALAYPGKRVAVAAGTAVAAFAALVLAASLLGPAGGLDWLALRTPVPGAPAFRVVHTSTLAFILTGAALAGSAFARGRRIAAALASAAAIIALFALLGVLTGIDALYGPAAAIAAPPLPTAAGLLFVACGILLRTAAMPALRTPRPLWQLLAALGCAILAPLLLYGAFAEVTLSDARLDEASKALMNGARAVSADYDRMMSGELERLQALAASPSLRQSSGGDGEGFAAFRRQAEASLAVSRNGNIMLVDREMRQIVNAFDPSSDPSQLPDGLSLNRTAVAEPVALALATGRPQFTGLFIGPVTRMFMLAIVVPVAMDGENRYALVRSISRRTLAKPIAPENLPPGWQAVISNAARHVLVRTLVPLTPSSADAAGETGPALPAARPRDSPEFAMGQQSIQNIVGRPGGVFTLTDAEGRPALAGYAVSSLTGWETVIWEPQQVLEAPVRALWRTLGWLALISLGLVAALALWLGRLIAGSVARAASAAAELGEGGAPAGNGTPVAEVNMLMAELREAAARRQTADAMLRDSERRLRFITDNVPIAITSCDAEGRVTFANRYFAERHGRPAEQIIGKRLPQVIGHEAFAAVERYVSECLAGAAVECQLEVRDRRGAPMFLHSRFEPEWRDGRVVGLTGATSDITRLKLAEQRLRASEDTFRQLVDNSPFGIYVVDADLRLVQASVGARQTFDDSTTPLIGRNLADVVRSLWPQPVADEKIARFRDTLATGEPYHAPATTVLRNDTGAVESYDWKIERLTMPDGRFGVVCHFYDLSERQKYEAALRESEATFRAMFDSSAVGKIEIETKTGRFLRANAAMCRLVGYTEAELMDRTVFDITYPADREEDRSSLRNMDAGHLPVFDKEKRYVRKDGSIVWARVTANTIRDADGLPLRNTAVIQDIGARKQAEEELETSRTRLQLALDAAQLGWFQYDPARRSGRGDARFREIYDFCEEEIPFAVMMERVHPDDLEKVQISLAEHLDPINPTPAVLEFRIRRRDGEIRWVEVHGLAYFEGEGPGRRAVSLIGTAQDITERKAHEEQTQLLMREVNHRAKNMLSVVDAIAHQTASRNPEDFITRFSERIQALSANQDLLVRNEWKGVGVAELVRAQLAHFSDLADSRIVIRGEPLRLQAASAQAIGLALHELATNAGKYGALSNDVGRVTVTWRTGGDMFRIDWEESGGPPVSPPRRRGFGTVVMESMAERTVGGKVELHHAPSGVKWRLTCPAANVIERPEREAGQAKANGARAP